MNTYRLGKFLPVAALLLFASSCGDKTGSSAASADDTDVDALIQTRDSLQHVIANQDSLLALINDLGTGMDEIKALENILTAENLSSETPNLRQKIRNDMNAIQQELNDRRQRLAELEGRLNKSNSNNAHLRKAIVSLRNQIAAQESTITSLRGQLASANIYIEELTQNVDSLNSAVAQTIEEKNEVIQENVNLSNEMNTCYYALGSKSELKAHNIISTGFLKKTKIMPDDFEQAYFTQGDKRNLSTIPLHSKKAKVLSSQPESSYQITTDANGMKELKITNPAQFWAKSNYLIIQID